MSTTDVPADPVTQAPLANLPTNTYQLYQSLATYWQTVITNLQAQLVARTLDQPINAYAFDAGEGKQSTTRMSLEEIQAALGRAVGWRNYYYQKINGRGLMTMGLRRR